MTHLNRRRFLQAASLSAVALGGGCVAPGTGGQNDPGRESATGWTSFRGDPNNTGYLGDEPRVGPEPTVKWTFEAGGDFWGSPIVADGTVYTGNADGQLYAIDAETGTKEWQFRADGRIETTPAYAAGTVYVGSYDRHVYALAADTGEKRWELATDGLIRGSPKVVGGTLYIGVGCHNLACKWYADDPSENGWVYSVDTSTGEPNWIVEIGDEVVSSPAIDEETVYIGSSDSNLYALDRSNGDERWRYGTWGRVWASPTLVAGTVYVSDWNAKVYAVDATTGTEEWTYDTFGSYITGSTAVDEETVYVGATPGNAPPETTRSNAEVFALDRTDGEEQWTYTTDALETGSSPVVTEDAVYIGGHSQVDEDGTGVYALTTDGDERWFFEVRERGVGVSPALLDGVLYFGGADDHLYALG